MFSAFAAAVGAAALPASVFAASVVINEIAWMGSSASAHHEWIELYNGAAEPVDLTGWTLVAFDGTPNISLQGSVAAGGLFLLERTSDDTVPGIAADQLYTGALGNTGETLSLKDSGGETVDTVVGGADWASIGGSNETKATAQRTESGWVTATGTPRAATAFLAFSSGSTGDGGGAVSSDASSSMSSVSSAPPVSGGGSIFSAPAPSIRIRAAVPPKGVAGADILFSGEAEGIRGEPLQNARFRWSFGDGGSAEGKKVFHGYHYPGAYAVFLDVSSGEASATARGDIVIAPAQLRVSRLVSGSAGFIEIANDGADEINLSFWHLRSAGSFFTIPAHTVILPKRAVSFPSAITKLLAVEEDAALLYPNGSVAARFVALPAAVAKDTKPPLLSVSVAAAAPALALPISSSGAAADSAPAHLVPAESPIATEGDRALTFDEPLAVSAAAVTEAARANGLGMAFWFAAVAALSAVSVGGYMCAVRTPQKEQNKAEKLSEEAEEYDLVE